MEGFLYRRFHCIPHTFQTVFDAVIDKVGRYAESMVAQVKSFWATRISVGVFYIRHSISIQNSHWSLPYKAVQ